MATHDVPIPPSDHSDSVSVHSVAQPGENVAPSLAKDAELITSQGNVITKDGTLVVTHESTSSLNNPFKDPEVREYYKGVYEDAKYECRHVFNADATWSEEEEKKVIRKLDMRGKNGHIIAQT